MLLTLIVLSIVLWMLGFSFKVGGGYIHILIAIALFALIIRIRLKKKYLDE